MSNTPHPLVSIIIRAKDEAESLTRLLPLIAEQKTDFIFETWILDNESKDDTIAIAGLHGASVHTVSRKKFNYADALNQGAKIARGSIVVNLSAHCFPQNNQWLTRLVEPLRHNDNVIATYGRQLFDPKKSPYAVQGNHLYFPPAVHQLKIVAFSNANAAIRREAILQHPFNPVVKIFEDHLFYLETSNNFLFEYIPAAVVLHEQDDLDIRYFLKRWQLEGWGLYFILKQRGYSSPFKTHRYFQPNMLLGYARLAGKLFRGGQKKLGMVTFPFHFTREIVWTLGWLYGRLTHLHTAKQDRDFLLGSTVLPQFPPPDTSQTLLTGLLGDTGQTGENVNSKTEEFLLKADWAYLRQNIARFIRQCYDRDDVFQNPVLEVGASGQNDYLKERFELITSNLTYNRQGAELAVDMEDMRDFENNSIGSILCSEVIEHVKHPEKALAEAFRILKPGGTLILTTPYAIVIHNKVEDGEFHGQNFTPQGLELRFVDIGFKIKLLETRGKTLTRKLIFPSNIFVIGEKPNPQ